MSAFRSANALGCEMIETDIRMTRDGELVLIHDRSTLRTSGIDKNVDELTLSELREIDLGAGERVPTVREFAEFLQTNGMLVNWELKIYPKDFGDDYAFLVADKLIELIEEYGLEGRSMLNSFSNRVLEYLYKKAPKKYPIHGQGIYKCRRANDEANIPETELFDWCCLYPEEKDKIAVDYPESFEYCKQNGIIPCICIKDEYETYKLAIEYGCRMFTSNDIRKADEILRSLGVR